jgi:hypothetical protein
VLIFQPPVNFCSHENIQTIFGTKLEDFLNYRINYNSISQTVEKAVKKIFFPTSSLKMTFSSLNLEMKVGVCITCEESKSLPSLVGKVKKKFDPHLGMYILSLK